MRSKLWVLTKVFLKNGSEVSSKGKKRALSNLLLITFIMISMFASIGIPFSMFIGTSYKALAPIGQQGAILAFVFVISCLAIFVFGIFYVLTTFYFSRDVEFLLPLPLNPYEIVGAKFITVILYEYLTEIVLLAPALITYGIKSYAGIVYYIYSLIIFLTLPIIPIVLAAVINMVIMRFTNIGKHKDRLKVIGGILALFIGLSINVFIQRNAVGFENQEQLVQMIITEKNSLVGVVSSIFPSTKIAALALVEATTLTGIQNLIIFLIITVAFTGIFLILAQILYLKGIIGVSETYSKRKKLTGSELEKGLTENSSIKSYTIKELRVLFRTPAYFMNCVIMNFLWPVFFIIPAATQKGLIEKLGTVANILSNQGIYGIIIAVTFGISLFVSGSNGITSTSISREGQNIFVNKYLPMRYRDQLIAKILSGVILSGAGIVLILGLVTLLMKPPLYLILLMIVVALIGIAFTALTGIFIDLKFPKLNWDNEQKAVKQNFNMVINMFLGIAVAILLVYLTINFKMAMWPTFVIITAVFAIVDIVLYYLLCSVGEKMFNSIEP